ncbi:MAG: septum formation initiator family protein [Hyphomicrobiaceae bacterium]
MLMQRPSLVLLLCCCLTSYFGYHAVHGNHGLEARNALHERAELLARELRVLEAERLRLDREVELLSPKHPDPDFIQELARAELGYARPNELILLERDPRVAALR